VLWPSLAPVPLRLKSLLKALWLLLWCSLASSLLVKSSLLRLMSIASAWAVSACAMAAFLDLSGLRLSNCALVLPANMSAGVKRRVKLITSCLPGCNVKLLGMTRADDRFKALDTYGLDSLDRGPGNRKLLCLVLWAFSPWLWIVA
jgi:hypothetical protein